MKYKDMLQHLINMSVKRDVMNIQASEKARCPLEAELSKVDPTNRPKTGKLKLW